jgi:predicted DNA-binding transcriptional regulator AlpA
MITDPSAVSSLNSTPPVDSAGASTAEAAPKPDEHERRRQRRARLSVPDSAIRLLTVKEASAELGVAPIWFWQHRNDPELPRPLRLGDASNPKSPLRYRESELLGYIERMQQATDAQRVGNQTSAAK